MFFKFLVFLEIIILFTQSIFLSFGDFIIDDFEIEKSSPTPINGSCGSATTQATLTAPSTNLCASGTPTSVTSGLEDFSWSCSGVSGGTTSSCSVARQYTVTYDGNGGSAPTPGSQKVIYNNEIGSLATSTRAGYIFKGWFDSQTGGTQVTQNTKVVGNMTVYAQWDLTINGVCGSATTQATLTAPSTNLCASGTPTSVTSRVEDFSWSCSGVSGGTTSSCSVARQYTVTYDGNGGSAPTPGSQKVIYNNEIGSLATSTRAGYIFKGWFDSQTGGTQVTQNTKVVGNMTVYAQWDLTINGVCGSATTQATLTAPSTNLCASGIASSITSGTGSFTWSCDGQGGTTSSCSVARQYTITYDGNGGSAPTPGSQKVIYDNEIGTLSTTERTGYTFQGWFDSATGGTQVTQNTKVVSNMTAYARWLIVASSSSGGGGGGASITPKKDNCPEGDFSPTYYDGVCGDTPKEPPISVGEDPVKNTDTPEVIDTKTPPEKPVNPIIEKKKLKQCEENELVKARQCVFPKVNVSFSDIGNSFAKKYIQSLGNSSIMQGYYDTSLFKPENTISRAEYLKVLLRSFCVDYTKAVTYNISYTDVDKNAWEAKVIAKALELGVIDKKNSLFRPHDPVTRAEALKMIFQISGVIPKEAYITRFEDVDQSGWEVKYIQKANNMCVVDGYTIDGKVMFQPYKNMTRAEVSKVIANALLME